MTILATLFVKVVVFFMDVIKGPKMTSIQGEHFKNINKKGGGIFCQIARDSGALCLMALKSQLMCRFVVRTTQRVCAHFYLNFRSIQVATRSLTLAHLVVAKFYFGKYLLLTWTVDTFQFHEKNHSGHIEKVKAEISDCGGNGSQRRYLLTAMAK